MEHAKQFAELSNQAKIILSYDLAIAKMAMQIQIMEHPRYENIFVSLGGLHVQLAFFKAVGKMIDSSGIEEILVQSEVIAHGSLYSFISSKHFNRCKRIHPLLAAAPQALHMERFMSEKEIDPETVVDSLKFVMSNPVESCEELNVPRALQDVIEQYTEFSALTKSGSHGKQHNSTCCTSDVLTFFSDSHASEPVILICT